MRSGHLFTTLVLASALATVAHADPITVGADATIAKVLEAQTGKTVTLKLGCNEELTGKVKAVSADVVHLSELSGKEFFDAAVATDDIVAVVARAR